MPLGFQGQELVHQYIQLRLGEFGQCPKCGEEVGIDMFWGHRVHLSTIQVTCESDRELSAA